MSPDPGTAAAGGAVEVKTSLPPAGGLQLLELARSTDLELAGAAPGQPGAPVEPALPLERELAGMFAMMGAGAGHFLPSVKRVLDDEACKALGDALAPVAKKYGLERYLAGFAWRIELQAVMVTVPIGMAIVAAAKHDLAAAAAAQASFGQAPPAAPASRPPSSAPMLEPTTAEATA